MVVVIDDGQGFTNFVTEENIIKSKEALKTVEKADAVILSNNIDENVCEKIVKNLSSPCLAVGKSAAIVAKVFGAKSEGNIKNKRAVIIKAHSPITLGLKKRFVADGSVYKIKDMPEDFKIIANSRLGVEIYQHMQFPIFGVCFSAGTEIKTIVKNFLGFLDMWKKYH